jgi:hypothetical protein
LAKNFGCGEKIFGDTRVKRSEVKRLPYLSSGIPDGQYVVIQFITSFTNKKPAIETVTPMLDSDGIWRVSGYYIK